MKDWLFASQRSIPVTIYVSICLAARRGGGVSSWKLSPCPSWRSDRAELSWDWDEDIWLVSHKEYSRKVQPPR